MVKKVIKKVFMRKKEKEKERETEKEKERQSIKVSLYVLTRTQVQEERNKKDPGRLSLERPELGTTRKKSKKGRSSTNEYPGVALIFGSFDAIFYSSRTF